MMERFYMKIYFILFILFVTGCSGLLPHRTYLEEMSYEDGDFFEAGIDFPVVNGDTGRTYRTTSDWRSRIPASTEDLEKRGLQAFLKEELAELENNLTQNEEDFYESYEKYLSTTSEKIYFLRLTPFERRYYLQSRGLLPMERGEALKEEGPSNQRELAQGMSKDQVKKILGSPQKVDVDGNPWFQNERWSYQNKDRTHFVYFQAGRVEAWE
jgi:hypothetical protein